LLDDTFIEFLHVKQAQYRIDPHYVIFEILEDIILSDLSKMPLKNLHVLKAMGYRLALDDFGSDRSNLNRLENIGVQFLKIDGQFVLGIDKNSRNQNIVETITAMAHKMNLQVIAEFVSTQAEYETVKRLGVDFSQGFFFEAPAQFPKPVSC